MMHNCDNCGNKIDGYRRKKNRKNYCSNKCHMDSWRKYYDGQTIIRERENADRGEKHKRFFYRYVYIKTLKRFKEEHRLVMEKHLGRKLKTTDVVHHINEDTLDNRVENLRVFESAEDHLKAHGRAELEEDFNQENINTIYEIFGTEKYLSDGGGTDYRSIKYGIKTIFYKRKPLVNDTPPPEPVMEYGYTENCLTYSRYFLERYINEFLLMAYFYNLLCKK